MIVPKYYVCFYKVFDNEKYICFNGIQLNNKILFTIKSVLRIGLYYTYENLVAIYMVK